MKGVLRKTDSPIKESLKADSPVQESLMDIEKPYRKANTRKIRLDNTW